MTIDLFLGLLAFVTVATITPGPNNIMVMASGANFGFSRTLPHIFGIMGGFTTMVAVVGLGLGRVFTAVPELEVAMRFVAFAFLIYLAWKIARSAPPKQGDTGALPLTLWQAVAFQWVNPKAWAMALSAHAVYAPGGAVWAALLVAMAFGIVSVPCVSLWALAGTRLRSLLSRRRYRRIFNGIMAGLLIASMAPALLSA